MAEQHIEDWLQWKFGRLRGFLHGSGFDRMGFEAHAEDINDGLFEVAKSENKSNKPSNNLFLWLERVKDVFRSMASGSEYLQFYTSHTTAQRSVRFMIELTLKLLFLRNIAGAPDSKAKW